MYDLLILNGRIITGSGNPWFYGDLAVANGKIARIGRLAGESAPTIIDALGCVVCPGFIDGHSHSDLFLFVDPEAQQKVLQGVTTENLGLDGISVAPIDRKNIAAWQRNIAGLDGDPGLEWTWRSFSDYLDAIDALPASDNVTAYVGLGTIRLKVMGLADRPPTGREMAEMKELAARAMAEGARGVSSALIYPPSMYQSVEEMAEITRVVRDCDGIFDVHLRSESDHMRPALEEVLEVGRRSGVPVNITHFKVMGRKNWGRSEEMLELIDQARREGLDVHLAQYPYIAGSTMFQSVIPPWYQARGPEGLIRALKENKEEIKRDIGQRTDWENFAGSSGWENIFVSSVGSEANKSCEGKNVVEIAALRGLDDPAEAALDLLAEEELDVGMVVFSMDETDVVNIMRHPAVSFITDGLLGGAKPHPRVYGTFPRILGHYVRERGVLKLEEAIRKMTSLSAEKLRLKSKGLLAEGYDADITVFNPDTIIDRATFAEPRKFSAGIEWVLVNGQVVVEKGRHTGARPGRTVRTH